MAAEWLRVGLERPHFLPLARGQKTIGVAPAQPIGRAVKTFRTDRSSSDAVFSRRAGRTSSFHLVFLNNRGRGEELFTPLLHRGLRQSLHGARGAMVRQINPMHVPKRTELHADRNDGRAGATPSRRKIAARSLRPSGVTPASCCWNPQLVFWPRRMRESEKS